MRRPFWVNASNYYVLVIAISIGFFFAVWGILHDEGEETPWITAGIASSVLLIGAVIFREVVLRRALRSQMRQEAVPVQKFASVPSVQRGRNKLSLEQNTAIIGDIMQKSNAAKVLNKFSAGHREVFELCTEYVELIDSELKTVNAGSPRLAGFLKGRKMVADLHRYHLLQWAEIEARSFTGEANSHLDISDKIKSSKDALGVIDFALGYYPAEPSLVESRDLLTEMVVSIRVSDHIEKAERAVFRGDLREALTLYGDALFYLGRDNVQTPGRQQAADRINAEIDKIRLLETGE